MVKRRMILNGHQDKATSLSNHMVAGEATSLGGGVQIGRDTMPIHRCLEMILLAYR